MGVDLFGRKFVFRPIYYTTLLSRIVKFSAKLIDLMEKLHELDSNRLSETEKDGYVKNVNKSVDMIVQGFEFLKEIAIDSFTLLHRDVAEIKSDYYEDIIKKLQKEEGILQNFEQDTESNENKIEKRIKQLQKEQEDLGETFPKDEEEELTGDLAELEREKKEIEAEQVYIKEVEDLINEMQQGSADLLKEIHDIAHHEDNAAKSLLRDLFVPTVAIQEFTMRSDKRLAIRMKREGLDEAGLHKECRALINHMESNVAKMRSLKDVASVDTGKLLKDEKQLFETEKQLFANLVKDTELIENFDHILIHNLLHHYLHRISYKANPLYWNLVKDRVHEAHAVAQKMLEVFRVQTKRLSMETRKF